MSRGLLCASLGQACLRRGVGGCRFRLAFCLLHCAVLNHSASRIAGNGNHAYAKHDGYGRSDRDDPLDGGSFDENELLLKSLLGHPMPGRTFRRNLRVLFGRLLTSHWISSH